MPRTKSILTPPFQDDSLSAGEITLPDARLICLFNWRDDRQTISVRLPEPCKLTDYWSGTSLGEHRGVFTARDMAPHSAALLVARAR